MLQRPVEYAQYASELHRWLLKDYQITQSMSRKENCWGNSAMESFFKPLKVELVYPQPYATRANAYLDIVSWMDGFYNAQRPHSSIGYMAEIDAGAFWPRSLVYVESKQGQCLRRSD